MNAVRVRSLIVAELTVERRAGDTFATTLPFAVAALLVVALTVGAQVPLLREIGTGLYWALVLLFGALVTQRNQFVDVEARRDALRLIGVDPVTAWIAGAAVTSLLVLAFELVLAPVAYVLYDLPTSGLVGQSLAAVLAAVGVGALGSWASMLMGATRTSRTLVPLIVTPVGLPLVLAGSQIQQGATYDASPVPWLLLSFATVLVVTTIGLLSSRLLEGDE